MNMKALREAQAPAIELISVPALGSYLRLRGKVRDVDPKRVGIAVYIRVSGGWWTKPYWEAPVTSLTPDGSFSVDITTGGQDEQASDIAVFLIPEDYHPPGARGEFTLPEEVVEKALARADVDRTMS